MWECWNIINNLSQKTALDGVKSLFFIYFYRRRRVPRSQPLERALWLQNYKIRHLSPFCFTCEFKLQDSHWMAANIKDYRTRWAKKKIEGTSGEDGGYEVFVYVCESWMSSRLQGFSSLLSPEGNGGGSLRGVVSWNDQSFDLAQRRV